MTVTLNVKQTHDYAYTDRPTEVGFVIYITPEKTAITRNTHYIIMIDNSPSMQGEKLSTAVESAKKLLSDLPPGNFVTIIAFSNHPEIKYQGPTGSAVNFDVGKGYTTRLHEAISFSLNLAKQSQVPTKIIMLTDGKPTDKRNVKDYEKLDIPQNVQIITIGIGKDYNEEILKKLADKSAGNFYHIQNTSELPNVFEKERSTSAYAYNLQFITPQGFIPYNYDLPIRLPIIDKLTSIYGSLVIPPGNTAFTVFFTITYIDPVDNQQKNETKSVVIQRGNTQIVESHINRDVLLTIRYYRLLREYTEALVSGKDTTRILNQLRQIAEETRRSDLIEQTEKLGSDKKADLSEVTKKMRS
ncbi:hypothetical protein BFU36_01090 [Sulfolobus sp. A20]|uniref:VWA domain-containing protein n=1 Tax=Saccharolobus sp. A20 TaxID=1891280 RepID=UPI000845BE72|nr:VWA domain-containing protein [Sulfolobus sp. A20]AOL15559.1 hypothetical protein BFU36_01090 [Sulfolobus sp. A20]TRM76182.1 VWA domain-containing protein [Sulfolobus sp. E5]TRM93071.1 VWA domain-containing protein [Sulfolobus sp. A20-N-G8]TRM98973.1 VWA domain-containing protein [Sulfolobus sp. E1]